MDLEGFEPSFPNAVDFDSHSLVIRHIATINSQLALVGAASAAPFGSLTFECSPIPHFLKAKSFRLNILQLSYLETIF